MNYLLNGEESERLHLRLLEPTDFDIWETLFDSENTALFLGLDPKLSPQELCQIWFDKVFHRYENNLGGMNVLIDKVTNELVGQCGLLIQTVEGEKRLEIGYSILPQHRNKGFASEAAQFCKNRAFENNWSDQLISMVHVDNISSEKVAIKNGMQLEKRIIDDGSPMNIFNIERSEWERQKIK